MSDIRGEPGTSQRPIVSFYDPLTWSREFSYEVEAEILKEAGADLVVPADEAERDELLPRVDALISSGTTPVDDRVIQRLERCVVIQCYSVGMDAVDGDSARSAGIRVANVNASTADVADHTMALLLAMERQLPQMFQATGSGEWDLRKLPETREIRRLEGQTLGIVGAGRIGRAVARRARAFGFSTIAYDIASPNETDPGLEMVGLDELISRSDAIALCAALTPESRHVIDASSLRHVKPGAFLVNAARGGLIDESALAEALDDGRIRMVALDVRDPEPPDPEHDRLSSRNDVIQTPHMAAMSERTRSDVHHLVGHNIVTMLREAGRLPTRAAS